MRHCATSLGAVPEAAAVETVTKMRHTGRFLT